GRLRDSLPAERAGGTASAAPAAEPPPRGGCLGTGEAAHDGAGDDHASARPSRRGGRARTRIPDYHERVASDTIAQSPGLSDATGSGVGREQRSAVRERGPAGAGA